MTAEIIIGVLGLLLSVATYFAGVKRAERNFARDQREQRWGTVLDRYMEFRRIGSRGGLDALQRAGVSTLDSDSDVRKLIQVIQQHGEGNPLGANPEWFDGVDLKRFFDWSVAKKIGFGSMRAEKALEQFKNEA